MTEDGSKQLVNDRVMGRIMPYFIQKKGYYSGTVETTYYARLSESTLNIYLKGFVENCQNQYPFSDFCQLQARGSVERQNRANIKKFIAKHDSVYVYGAGQIAEDISKYSHEYKAYIVSDGQKKPHEFHNKKVWYLSEVVLDENDGIIVAMDQKHSMEVLPNLERLGYAKNIMTLKR